MAQVATTTAVSGSANTPAEHLSVTIVLPVVDETSSLRETVQILMDENASDILEILCIVCRKTSAESLAVCHEMQDLYPEILRVRAQKRPFLGGAIQDAFEWANGTHVLLMASDLETDPHAVTRLIGGAKEGWDIVTATRWTAEGGFQGYNPVKYVLNWVFQKGIGTLYMVKFSDLTFGFRIFRAAILKNIRWDEVRHPFLLECILKPIRLGATVKEIPSRWQARREGQSHNSFWRNFVYFRTALKVRFASRRSLRGQ